MDNLKNALVLCWNFGKDIYSHSMESPNDWAIADNIRRTICDKAQNEKEKHFLRVVTSAIMDFYEDEQNGK